MSLFTHLEPRAPFGGADEKRDEKSQKGSSELVLNEPNRSECSFGVRPKCPSPKLFAEHSPNIRLCSPNNKTNQEPRFIYILSLLMTQL